MKAYRPPSSRPPRFPRSTYRPFYAGWLRRLALDPDAPMASHHETVSCTLEGTEDGLAPRVVVLEHGEPVGSLGPADELGVGIPEGLETEATE